MIENWAAALESTAFAGYLRNSVWAYPLVNAGHILGVALLVGAIVPLDLRLIGAWKSLPLAPLWRVLTRTAAAGLGLAILCGALLFIARATAYVQSLLFISKMALVIAGVGNAVGLHLSLPVEGLSEAKTTRRTRLTACISLVVWLTTLLLGRLIGYF